MDTSISPISRVLKSLGLTQEDLNKRTEEIRLWLTAILPANGKTTSAGQLQQVSDPAPFSPQSKAKSIPPRQVVHERQLQFAGSQYSPHNSSEMTVGSPPPAFVPNSPFSTILLSPNSIPGPAISVVLI
ncbi:hypothetical protein B0H13DRAFT_2322046 [Mycena leptocephala]|nr:hypothetical protein B0H13DRAFT_2322046 [Mycena leptocephala]